MCVNVKIHVYKYIHTYRHTYTYAVYRHCVITRKRQQNAFRYIEYTNFESECPCPCPCHRPCLSPWPCRCSRISCRFDSISFSLSLSRPLELVFVLRPAVEAVAAPSPTTLNRIMSTRNPVARMNADTFHQPSTVVASKFFTYLLPVRSSILDVVTHIH